MTAQALLQRATGLNLSEDEAERALRQRMAELNIGARDDYLRRMSKTELQALIELVVVPESWMFRDPQAFVAMAAFVRERLAAHPQGCVRILSLPCAGGEEPYSIAMALADAGVPAAACCIDAVDLSAVALARARSGLYTGNAFRGAELGFRERYFTPEGSDYRIDQKLRARVNFAEGNLLTFDTALDAPSYDVIFCRNLLIYFDEATIAAAIARLRALLAGDGLLFAGYAEVPAFCRHGFSAQREPGAFALHKHPLAPVPLPAASPRKARAARPVAAPAPAAPAAAVPAVKRAAQPAAAPVAPAVDVHTLLARARSQADQGELPAAAASCRGVLAAAPDSADAYFILGLVSECAGDDAEAETYLRRCVYLQPDHYDALCHLALRLAQDGKAGEAAALRQRAARVQARQLEDRGQP